MKKKYLITNFIPKNNLEREEYLLYPLIRLDEEKDIKTKFSLEFYIKNQNKIINFFKYLYYLNDSQVICCLKSISTFSKYYFLKNERKTFFKYLKKIDMEQLFFDKMIKIEDIDTFKFYIKFGYRVDKKDIMIIFKNLKIKLESTGEYSYIMTIDENSELYHFFD